MTELTLAATVIAVAGLLFLGTGAARLRRRRLLAACGHGVSGLSLVLVGALFGALLLNLHTYQRLTRERDVAILSFAQLSPQRYAVTLEYPDGEYPDAGERRRYELQGDEWQLDARILKWHGAANLLGLDALYRVERLSGRYREVSQELGRPRSVFPLSSDPGVDLWRMAQRYERWLPWVDASYGSATYLPMADGARFQVRITQSGLVARPVNAAGRKAVQAWQ